MTEDNSNTGENRRPGQFVKGDPRINRKGRPRSFDALRRLAIKIAIEDAGGDMTQVEKILRDLARSRVPSDRYRFLDTAYGKIPEEVKQTGEMRVIIEYGKNNPTETTPEATPDKGGEEAV